MAIDVIPTSTQIYGDFFQRRVVKSTERWQKFVIDYNSDTPQLEKRQGRILRAISFALASEAAWPAARQLIESFAPYMERRGYWDTWQDILVQAIAAAELHEDTAGQIMLTVLLARLRQDQSHFRETIKLYRTVIYLSRSTNNQFEEARACSNLAFLFTDSIKQLWRAEILACYALEMFENLDSLHGRAHTENHLGLLYISQKNLSKAEAHLKKACHLWQEMNDNNNLLSGYTNLGMLFYESDATQEALNYLTRALKQAELVKAEAELGNILNIMGLVYRKCKNIEKAELCFKRAEKIFRELSNPRGLAQIWGNIGVNYLYQNNQSEAIRFIDVSLIAFKNLKDLDGRIKLILDVVEYHLFKKDKSQAEFWVDKLDKLTLEEAKVRIPQYLIEKREKYHKDLISLTLM